MRPFRRSPLLAALAALPLSLTLVAADTADCRTIDPDGVADTGDEYELCTVQTYLHASDANKAANLADEADSPFLLPTWDTNPPAGSVTGGNGAGYAASSPASNADEGRAVWEGTFEGELDSMDVDLHILYPLFAAYQPDDINLTVVIDGEPLVIASKFEVKESPAETASTPVDLQAGVRHHRHPRGPAELRPRHRRRPHDPPRGDAALLGQRQLGLRLRHHRGPERDPLQPRDDHRRPHGRGVLSRPVAPTPRDVPRARARGTSTSGGAAARRGAHVAGRSRRSTSRSLPGHHPT